MMSQSIGCMGLSGETNGEERNYVHHPEKY